MSLRSAMYMLRMKILPSLRAATTHSGETQTRSYQWHLGSPCPLTNPPPPSVAAATSSSGRAIRCCGYAVTAQWNRWRASGRTPAGPKGKASARGSRLWVALHPMASGPCTLR
eukprot:XP_001700013.1 predicted protein [Chlamydomonas reinhardtii]